MKEMFGIEQRTSVLFVRITKTNKQYLRKLSKGKSTPSEAEIVDKLIERHRATRKYAGTKKAASRNC